MILGRLPISTHVLLSIISITLWNWYHCNISFRDPDPEMRLNKCLARQNYFPSDTEATKKSLLCVEITCSCPSNASPRAFSYIYNIFPWLCAWIFKTMALESVSIYICSPFLQDKWPQTHGAAENDFKLLILLPPPTPAVRL